jgi:hypothetical protein
VILPAPHWQRHGQERHSSSGHRQRAQTGKFRHGGGSRTEFCGSNAKRRRSGARRPGTGKRDGRRCRPSQVHWNPYCAQDREQELCADWRCDGAVGTPGLPRRSWQTRQTPGGTTYRHSDQRFCSAPTGRRALRKSRVQRGYAVGTEAGRRACGTRQRRAAKMSYPAPPITARRIPSRAPLAAPAPATPKASPSAEKLLLCPSLGGPSGKGPGRIDKPATLRAPGTAAPAQSHRAPGSIGACPASRRSRCWRCPSCSARAAPALAAALLPGALPGPACRRVCCERARGRVGVCSPRTRRSSSACTRMGAVRPRLGRFGGGSNGPTQQGVFPARAALRTARANLGTRAGHHPRCPMSRRSPQRNRRCFFVPSPLHQLRPCTQQTSRSRAVRPGVDGLVLSPPAAWLAACRPGLPCRPVLSRLRVGLGPVQRALSSHTHSASTCGSALPLMLLWPPTPRCMTLERTRRIR